MRAALSRGLIGFVLLWLLGADLRVTILAVPPVLPLLHHDLHLDEKLVAALTGLPVLLFGLAAIPGSLLIARLGARRAAVIGVLVVAVAGALRGFGPGGSGPSLAMLFGMTALMGAGVAVMQPALPALVALWFPKRVPLATAVYANGLLVGEMLAAGLTIPLILPLVGGGWEGSFIFWSAPPLATAALMFALAPATPPLLSGERPPRWWPDWHDPRCWLLGLLSGGGAALYFGCNAFLPDYLHAIGRPGLVGLGLTALNLGQLPASLLIMIFGRRLALRRAPFIVAALIGMLALGGLMVPSAPVIVAAAALAGFAAAFNLILTLALPPMLAEPDDVHRLAAAMLAIGYTITFLVPYVSGAIWDATHLTASALLPGVAGTMIVIVGAAVIELRPRALSSSGPRR
ncbi:MAG: CynX/NimT family MFS transporter [Acetobacteraceae bacterium]